MTKSTRFNKLHAECSRFKGPAKTTGIYGMVRDDVIEEFESQPNEEEEEERLLWQINNNTMLYMISFATETPIKTCNMSLAWEPPYNIMI